MDVKGFLKRAFVPIKHNPGGIQTSAIITLIGAGVWAVCAIGEGFGLAIMPSYVDSIGTFIMGIGIEQARNQTKKKEESQ